MTEQETIKKIQEAVPGIMELKFGREVVVDIPRGDYNSIKR